ncbi:hypothetical protein [Gymnodinialimonas ceratoperidinii]|uniref:Uncharacterized protein n=1 Tax=Gymnodinialimonas ceratoperidinii TaxID=2856823 RepID=A0A8F6TVQ6_9RHOB|nr:hypothetical protein [Gymnodinialimonas ceratoperidinii]QXT39343.1 hypothetical protein KYE46_15665 [Gymnodinialimonas ceratoperidinii]
MIKGPRGLLVTLLGAAVVIASAFYFGFAGQRGDSETSRLFMTHAAAQETAQAHALLHPTVHAHVSVEELSGMMAQMAPYTQISFPSVSFSTSNGTRRTELSGTGSTDAGCESTLRFTLVDGLITAFEIEPLCREGASDV